jgi:hypothetical protein
MISENIIFLKNHRIDNSYYPLNINKLQVIFILLSVLKENGFFNNNIDNGMRNIY